MKIMRNLQNFGVTSLSIEECYQINGGEVEAAEGSYGLGYKIGSAIRDAFKSLVDAADVLSAPRPIGMY